MVSLLLKIEDRVISGDLFETLPPQIGTMDHARRCDNVNLIYIVMKVFHEGTLLKWAIIQSFFCYGNGLIVRDVLQCSSPLWSAGGRHAIIRL